MVACLQNEASGGDGGPSGVQSFDLGLSLFDEGLPDLAFYQGGDEQGQADDGDQGRDVPGRWPPHRRGPRSARTPAVVPAPGRFFEARPSS